jgi:hypothetical protein
MRFWWSARFTLLRRPSLGHRCWKSQPGAAAGQDRSVSRCRSRLGRIHCHFRGAAALSFYRRSTTPTVRELLAANPNVAGRDVATRTGVFVAKAYRLINAAKAHPADTTEPLLGAVLARRMLRQHTPHAAPA